MNTTESPFDLKGRVAIVTGAGQGVGRGIAHMLAAHNAAVAVNDFYAERADAVVAEIEEMGGKAVPMVCDVSDYDQVSAATAKVEEALGPVSILINNAGNGGPTGFPTAFPLFWETQPKDWDKFFRVNLFGVMNCCRAVTPGMAARKYGRIVTIVSDSGRNPENRQSDYSAAKAGAAGFMRGLAADGGRYGINCNSIAISSIQPAMSPEDREAFRTSDRSKAALSKYIIRRFGEPSDIAGMALLLSSDAASWITGQTYPVNGGYTSGL